LVFLLDFPLLATEAAGSTGFQWHTVAIALGVLLIAALIGGLVAQRFRLPKVTAYLLVGLGLANLPEISAFLRLDLLLHSDSLGVIRHENLQYLQPLERLAMAMVLFGMGCHFTLPHVRRILRHVLRLAAGEISCTFLLVSIGLFFVFWLQLGIHAWQPAVLMGAMAIATAPATTVLVLKETQAEGPMTEYVTVLVAINNLAAVILFEVLFLAVYVAHREVAIPIHFELAYLVRDLAGSLLFGLTAGLLMSYGCGMLAQRNWLVLLVGMTTLTAGICWALDIPYLLTFLMMGATVANASDRPHDLVGELDRWTGLLCVIFFVIHGAELDVTRLLKAGGLATLYMGAYIGLRSAGKYFGIFFTVGSRHEDTHLRPWLGATMLSQAGAAIALVSIAAASGIKIGDFELGLELQNIILGTVVVFEIVGPILLRFALLRGGEVPVGQAIRHSTTTPLGEFRLLINRVLVAFGCEPWAGRHPEDITVGKMMRRNPKAIPAAATFEEVMDFIEHSQDNTYPVIGAEGELTGIIRYVHLRDALFDADLGSLVCAADLAIPCPRTLHPDDPITDTWQHFHRGLDDSMPVVGPDPPFPLVGVVHRRDLYRIFRRGKQSASAG
jgi:Kef-type K+ transport system membrane component KefB